MKKEVFKQTMKRITKKGLISFLMMILAILPLASNGQQIIELDASKSDVIIRETNQTSLRVQYTFDALHAFEVKTQNGNFNELVFNNSAATGALGTPKLPAVKNLIEIPFGAEYEIIINGYTEKEYILADYGIMNPLMPMQPSLRKDQLPEDVPFELKAESYSKSGFEGSELANIEILGVLRGTRLARLEVAPVQYNPTEGTIKVFNQIDIEVRFTSVDMALTNHIKASTYSPYFQVIDAKIMNPLSMKSVFDDHPDLTKYPVKMLIVSNRMFEETLQPFIEWKTQMGFEVIVAYTDEIGTTATTIKNYIHGVYNAGTPEDPSPTFLVIVGDDNTLPASAIGSSTNVVSDLYYASVDGDYFPEMYLGRLSARTTQELQNQIDKILYYEKYEFADPTYLDNVTLIAGADGTWNPAVGQPTVHYGTQNYYNTENGFNTVNAYLNSYSGCYDNERVSVSLLNYTAHCSPTSWGDPSLTTSGVHNLTNVGKYHLAIGNCCQSSQFSVTECIGEAFLRAPSKGAVAYIGSSPSTYWFEDFYWSVGAFPISGNNNGYVPTVEETTLGAYDAPFTSDYVTVGALMFVGNLAVTEADIENYPQHSSPLYYWQAYHVFGDPSTVIYQKQGLDNEVSHLPIVPIGLDTYTVNALPGSYVAVSKDGVLYGAAFVGESGEVEVPIIPITDSGDVTIVVTKAQYKPYVANIPAAALEGPFIVLGEYTADIAPDYDQTVSLTITLKNVGADPVEAVTATLTGEDPYINITTNDGVAFSGMQAGDEANTATVDNAFTLQISKNVPNNYMATFALVITDGTEEWTSNLRISAFAPVFSINPVYTIDDSAEGNNNDGKLDPGETATITFEVTNNGDAEAKQPVISFAANSPYLTLENDYQELTPIGAGETAEVVIGVAAHSSTINGTFIDLFAEVEDGHWFESQSELVIGQVPEMNIGTGSNLSDYFPFYNYYKANRTQILYLNSELGAGEKTITELGFDIAQVADAYRDLPNFKIIMKHVDIALMSGSFVNISTGTVVFDAASYSMPTETGWHIWDIEDFVYDGVSNLLVEVVWGQLNMWTSTFYKVNTSNTPAASVAYGYSDDEVIATFDGTSTKRPNLHIGFMSQASEPAQDVTFIVKNQDAQPIANAEIKIGSSILLTDEAGQVAHSLFPGEYSFLAAAEGYDPHESASFVVADQPITVEITFIPPLRNIHFVIKDTEGTEIADAALTLNGNEYLPGQYDMSEMEQGVYEYLAKRENFYDKEGSFELSDHNIEVTVVMTRDFTSVEPAINPHVSIYPNPTKSSVTVQLNGFEIETCIMHLTNYQGQILQSIDLTGQPSQKQFNINMQNYSAGIYYIRIQSNVETLIHKIVLQ